MTPYRDAGAGAPSRDPYELVPGEGLRGIWVGRATPEDVLRTFGEGDRAAHADGSIFLISYDVADAPHQFAFQFGLLVSIEISATQGNFFTIGDLRIRKPRAEVLRVLGPPDDQRTNASLDTLRYLDEGIELGVSNDDDFGVTSITVFRARR